MGQKRTQCDQLKQALLKADQDTEKLLRMKPCLTTIISHELRTSLASIKEGVSLVLEGIAGPLNEDQKKFLTITKKNIDRLTKVIIDISIFTKLEYGCCEENKRKKRDYKKGRKRKD